MIDSFPIMFCYKLDKNQLLNIFFEKIMKIFQFLTFSNLKNLQFSAKTGLSNLIQASLIKNQQKLLIFGLLTAFRNQKIL